MKKGHFVLIEAAVVVAAIVFLFYLNPHFGLLGFAIYQDQPSAAVGKDVYIRNGSALNFDTDTVLKVGKTASDLEYRALISFDFSSIPEGSTILDSLVSFYAVTNNQPGMNITAYMLTVNWTENEATWTNRSSSSAWSEAGGDYNGLLIGSTTVSGASQIYNISLTSAVRGWMNGSYDNYGILLIANGAGSNNLTEFGSSDHPTSSFRPLIWVSYTENAAPTLTSIATSATPSSPANVGQQVQFTIGWSDLESDNSQIFVCNTSSISFPGGCGGATICNTSLSSTNPQSCSYTAQQSDNTTRTFFVAVCDATNCSTVNQSSFSVNHAPVTLLIAPNGGETLNQSLGNYSVRFNVSDSDADALTASFYYGSTQNSTSFPVVLDLPLASYCSDPDSTTATTNNCTYPWNTQGIYGEYFLTVIINDTYAKVNDSSNAAFSVRSLIDAVPPNITDETIDSGTIYSGRRVQIYANVSDPNINTVWVSINTTPQQNITMRNTTQFNYNATFVAPAVGIYEFKVYANDTLNNINNTRSPVQFNVTKPEATPTSDIAPTVALPYSLMQVSGNLDAVDPLTNIYAYLNAPSGFIFMQDYPQNLYLGNFTANQTKTARWFISTPINQSRYLFNITYSDSFSNTWQGANVSTNVTSEVAGSSYTLTVTDYPHVTVTAQYHAETSFKQNGMPVNADTVKISLYDPLGNLVIGPVDMVQEQTGIYNYSYTVPGAQTAGQWQTIINATINSVSYYANSFWKLVGALFDVREIQIENSAVDHLNISVEAENVGNAPTDLTLVWNLTRVDNDQVLDYGAETFAVSTVPVRWYVYPETTYVGQVKISFVGYYSQSEKAGAFEVFSTTAATGSDPETPSTGSGGGGGGGGGGGAPVESTSQKAAMKIVYDEEVLAAKNINEKVKIIIMNTGNVSLKNVALKITNLDEQYYSFSPEMIGEIKAGDYDEFIVDFIVTDFVGKKQFLYEVSSDQVSSQVVANLNVMLPADYLRAALDEAKARATLLRERISTKSIAKQLDACDAALSRAEESLKNDELIGAKLSLDEGKSCLDVAEKMIDKRETTLTVRIWNYDISMIILVVSLIAIIVLIIVLYVVLRKLNLVSFIKAREKIVQAAQSKEDDFEDKLKRIERKLKE